MSDCSFRSSQHNGQTRDITISDISDSTPLHLWQQHSMVAQQQAQVNELEDYPSKRQFQDPARFWASKLTYSLSDGTCVSGTARHLYDSHAYLRSNIQDLYNMTAHPSAVHLAQNPDAIFSELTNFENECTDVLDYSTSATRYSSRNNSLAESGLSTRPALAMQSPPSSSSFISKKPRMSINFAPLENVFGTYTNKSENFFCEDVLKGPGLSAKYENSTMSSSASSLSNSAQQPNATSPMQDQGVVGTAVGIIQFEIPAQPGPTCTSLSTSPKPDKHTDCAPVEEDQEVGDRTNVGLAAANQQPSFLAAGGESSLLNTVTPQSAAMLQAAAHPHWIDDFSGPDSAREFLAHPEPRLCQAFQIANDDVDLVKARFNGFAEQLYRSLLIPGVDSPPGFTLKTVAQEKFKQQQKTALKRISKLLSTPEQQKKARAYCYLALDAVVYVHKIGIPAGFVAEVQAKSTRIPSDRLGRTDLSSKCSQRLQNVIAAVTSFKLVALDLLSGKDMHRLAYDPNYYVCQKITYLLSNVARQESAEMVQRNKLELGLKVGAKRRKPW